MNQNYVYGTLVYKISDLLTQLKLFDMFNFRAM